MALFGGFGITTMTDKDRLNARMAGAIAALEGKKLDANTHLEDSEAHWEWLTGWTSARTERTKQNVALPQNHAACKCGRAVMAGELARGRCYCGAELKPNTDSQTNK